ncbi:MAG: S41 family peptidase [Pseudomonadales bacterium]
MATHFGCRLALFANAMVCVPAALANASIDQLQGVWRAPGYGFVLEVAGDRARVYGESSSGCFLDKAVTEELEGDLAHPFAYVETVSQNRIRTGSTPTTSLYTLDRLSELPAPCELGLKKTPTQTLAYLAAVMSSHYAFFKERNIDWPARVARARAQVTDRTSSKALRKVFADLLEGFNDSHLSLIGRKGWFGSFQLPAPSSRELVPLLRRGLPQDADDDDLRKARRSWYGGQITNTNKALFDGKGVRRSGLPLMWGKRGNIGVVVQIGMQGFSKSALESEDVASADAIFDEILAYFGDVDAVVFDVSLNFGGYGEVARAVASRFAAQKRFAYSRHVPAEGPDSLQRVYVEPSPRTRFTGPVYLLTSDMTVSAGEEFTMLMRVLDNVHHYGTPTNGSLSDVLPKGLPNGWVLTLSNQIYTMPDGVCYEGQGVPPEHPLPIYRSDNLETARFEAVEKLILIAAGEHSNQ